MPKTNIDTMTQSVSDNLHSAGLALKSAHEDFAKALMATLSGEVSPEDKAKALLQLRGTCVASGGQLTLIDTLAAIQRLHSDQK